MNYIKAITLFAVLSIVGCSSDDSSQEAPDTTSEVLMLQVNYTDHAFEGGKEFIFDEPSDTFTITAENTLNNFDFQEFELRFTELDEVLFYGSVIWAGSGGMTFPSSIEDPSAFMISDPDESATLQNGFENVLDLSGEPTDFQQAWSAVANLDLVKDYFDENPEQTVKIFLYTPSVGVGNPEEWKYIMYINK